MSRISAGKWIERVLSVNISCLAHVADDSAIPVVRGVSSWGAGGRIAKLPGLTFSWLKMSVFTGNGQGDN